MLANSGHEPFGLVGLETMAVGGVACTGCSGEDYAVPGYNALVLETNDPREFTALFSELHANPRRERGLATGWKRDSEAIHVGGDHPTSALASPPLLGQTSHGRSS